MLKTLAGIGLRGKRANEDDEELKANEDDEDARAAAKANEDDEDAKAEHDDEDAKAEDDDEDVKATATAQANKSARINAKAIVDLCELAGRPELSGQFIAAGASQSQVRRQLLASRAEGSTTGDISGQTGPGGSPASAAAMWDHAIKKNSRFAGHA